MDYIHLGGRYINLDNVYQISFNTSESGPGAIVCADLDTICPCYTDPDGENNPQVVPAVMHVVGREAEALRHYLDSHSDNVVATYTRYLEHEERVKKANAAEQQFQAFCTDKDLSNEEKYSFRYWLQNDTDESFGLQPGEESFAQWRDWQAGVFEQNIKNAAKSALIPEGRIEEFKEYCKQRGIAQPQYYEGLQFLNQQTKTVPMF